MAGPRKSHTDLARRIAELLRLEGLAPGRRVGEARLAAHFGVSRTPVRAALALLADQGLLVHRPNQGYRLAVPLAEQDAAVVLPAPEEDRLFEAILRDRYAKRLQGAVGASDLMQRYGVGRRAVTRVLNRMREEGLMERGLGQNWSFGPGLESLESLAESYRFRLLIEPAVLLEGSFRPEKARLLKVRDRHRAMVEGAVFEAELRLLVEADAEFHDALAACCGNRFLARAVQQQTRLRRLTLYQANVGRHRLAVSFREHLGILDALEEGRPSEAAQRMRAHILASQDQRPRFSARGAPPLARPLAR